MAEVPWQKVGKGLEYRTHKTRKIGVRFDRYYRARFTVSGKTRTVSFGWESTYVEAEKSRQRREGVKGSVSFLDYVKGEVARLKLNAVKGQGPVTIKEDRALAQAKAEKEKQAQVQAEREAVTFGSFFDESYLPIATTHKKAETIAEEKSIYKVWLKSSLGKIRLLDLRPLHLEKIKRDMLKKGRSPRRIQYVLAVTRQVWNTAHNQGLVSGDWPGRGVKLPKVDNRRMRFLSPKESEDLLLELKARSQQTHDMALVSLDCGLRFGEITKLQWGHIDIENDIIMVVDPKGIINTKNRAAFMTSRVKEMFADMPQGKKTDRIFTTRDGEPIEKISHSFSRSVDALQLNDGVEDRRDKVVFHSLRHSFASNLVSNGVDLYPVSQLLGHADVSMAARYSHLGAGSLRVAVAAMEKGMKEEVEKATEGAVEEKKVIPLEVNGRK